MAGFTRVTVTLEGVTDEGKPFTNTLIYIDPASVELKQKRDIDRIIDNGKEGFLPTGRTTLKLKVRSY